MRTNGQGNDSLITLVPIGVLVAVGVMLFGGPSQTLHLINAFVGETARVTMSFVSALFS